MSTKKKASNLKAKPELMQLEQRLMFDGAAVETTAQVITEFSGDAADHSDVSSDLLVLAVAYEPASPALEQAMRQVKEFFETASTEELFEIFNGGKDAIDAEWLQSFEATRQAILNDEVSISVELLSNEQMGGKLGAFAAEGPDGNAVIYLNQSYLDSFGAEVAAKVLVEEIGHAIDSLVNDTDSAGDEGQLFADRVNGIDNDASTYSAEGDNDHGELIIGGENIAVEWASFNFVNAYSMVYDLDNDGTVEGNQGETAAEKEQSTHNFDITSVTFDGTGAVTSSGGYGGFQIDDGNASVRDFSGNDVSAIGIELGGVKYFGWVSRPIKSGGIVRGFYFWTDTDFNNNTDDNSSGSTDDENLTAARTDGNTDSDSNALDNRGFILVVDQAWFNQQIEDTRVDLSNIDDTFLGSAQGITRYASVGSSSDRVDSALNNLLPTNSAPTATNTTDTIVEQGSATVATGGNTDSVSDTITGTLSFADSNVAAGDSLGDSVTVVNIGTTAANTAVSATGTIGVDATTINGTYGTLAVEADGSYSYTVDNSLAAVQALRQTTDTLTERFLFEVEDSFGEADTASFTITITGSNDNPVAANDYNTASESLLSDGTEYTATDPVGIKATGNVLSNDTDVDQYGETKELIDTTFTATNFTSSVSGAVINVTNLGANLSSLKNSVPLDLYIWNDFDGITSDDLRSDGVNGNWVATGVQVNGITTGNPNTFTVSDPAKLVALQNTYSYSAQTVEGVESVTNILRIGLADSDIATISSSTGDTTISSPQLSNTSVVLTNGMSVSWTAASGTVTSTISGVSYTGSTLNSFVVDNYIVPSDATLTFTIDITSTITGTYGELQFVQDTSGKYLGEYIYTPTDPSGLLFEGSTATDVFFYQMKDASGAISSATLTIDVTGSGNDDPDANDATATATEAGGVSNTSAGTDPSGDLSTSFSSPTLWRANVEGVKSVSDATFTTVGTRMIANGTIRTSLGTGTIWDKPSINSPYTLSDNDYRYSSVAFIPTVSGNYTFSTSPGDLITDPVLFLWDGTFAVDENGGDPTNNGSSATGVITSNDNSGFFFHPNEASVTATLTAGQTYYLVTSSNFSGDTGNADLFMPSGSAGSILFGNTAVINGVYGKLVINGFGDWTYIVDNSSTLVEGLLPTDTVQDHFVYTVDNGTGTNSATLTIDVTGSNDAPVASNDEGTAVAGSFNPLGNVFDNDTDLDHTADEFTVTAVRTGAEADGAGATLTVGTAYDAQYGTFTLNADGSWTYVVDNTNADVIALSDGQSLTETFTYTVNDHVSNTDYNGLNDQAEIVVTINGVEDTVIINNVFVNEGPADGNPLTPNFAMFTITGNTGVSMTLSLGTTGLDASDKLADTAVDIDITTLEFYDEATSTWIDYADRVSNPTIGASGELYVRVAVNPDDIYEGNESFTLVATTVDGNAATGIGTINDEGQGNIYLDGNTDGTPDKDADNDGVTDPAGLDDDRPQMTIADVSVEEGSTAIFNVTVGEADELYKVTFATFITGETAESNDFNTTFVVKNQSGVIIAANPDGSYDVPAFTTSLTVEVQTTSDNVYEGPETFLLTGKTEFMSTDTTGQGTITDNGAGPDGDDGNATADDDRPTLTVVGPVSPVSEGSYAVFKVDLSNPIGFDASVDLALSNLGGTSSTDYALEEVYYMSGGVETPLSVVSGGYVIPAGVTTFYVRTLTTSDDNLEGLEEFKLTATLEAAVGGASANDDAGIIDDGTGTVYDNQGDPTGGTPDDDTPPPPPPPPAAAPAEPPAGEERVEEVVEPEPPVADEPVIEPPAVELIVQRDIPLQEFTADGFSSISYTIPADTFGFVGGAEGGEITLSAVMADGEDLPDWLIFDEEKGEFRGIPPKGLDAVLVIRVLARDENGNQVETMITIQVKPGLSDQSSLQGKPGVMDQFKVQSQFAWKVERDKLLEQARKLRA